VGDLDCRCKLGLRRQPGLQECGTLAALCSLTGQPSFVVPAAPRRRRVPGRCPDRQPPRRSRRAPSAGPERTEHRARRSAVITVRLIWPRCSRGTTPPPGPSDFWDKRRAEVEDVTHLPTPRTPPQTASTLENFRPLANRRVRAGAA
jgi:hypothetical protein